MGRGILNLLNSYILKRRLGGALMFSNNLRPVYLDHVETKSCDVQLPVAFEAGCHRDKLKLLATLPTQSLPPPFISVPPSL